jgi:hypothetical protein
VLARANNRTMKLAVSEKRLGEITVGAGGRTMVIWDGWVFVLTSSMHKTASAPVKSARANEPGVDRDHSILRRKAVAANGQLVADCCGKFL